MEVLEQIDEDTLIIYMKFKGMMMVSGRDFVLCCKLISFEDPTSKDGIARALITFTVDHPNAPEVPKGTVRGEIIIGGWICFKLDETRTLLKNYAINDLKGIIPKFIINAGASTHGNLLTNFKKELDELNEKGELSNKPRSSQEVRIKSDSF